MCADGSHGVKPMCDVTAHFAWMCYFRNTPLEWYNYENLGSLCSKFSALHINPFKPNGFFHSYYSEKSILHFRGVRLIFSSLAEHEMISF